MNSIEIHAAQADELGEGPMWSEADRSLYWLDIARKIVYRKGLADAQVQSWQLPGYAGCLGTLTSGAIAVAMGEGVHRLDLQSGAVELMAAVPPQRKGVRFNDGKVDPRGRLWAGTMQNNFGPHGTSIAIERTDGVLYRFDPNGAVHTIEEDIGIANTLAWSPDLKRFYFADTLRGAIYEYDFDADSGAVCNKRVFFDAPSPGSPDGSAMDVDGCLWNARWDGNAILRITPEGKVDRVIALPALRPTSCAFGGPDLKTLYITSARGGLTPAQLEQWPQSGSVFAIHGLGQGTPVPAFACESAP